MSDNLEEMLRETKDTSELMIDLAYSSLLYSNKDIADEVQVMGESVREQIGAIQEDAVRRVADDKDAQKALAIIHLANSFNVISNAALRIADVMRRSAEPHPVIRLSLRDSDTIITSAEVAPESDLGGSTLGSVRLASQSGMWVIAIRRGRKYIYGPDRDTSLRAGDTLFVRGPEDGEEYFKDLASGKERLESSAAR
jgi:uncharacterized protein with PhoU and TrkA domain